jgi:chromosome segregation ATPase
MALRLLIAASMLAAPLVADAQSFRCVGKDGKRYYGSTIPEQCIGRLVEQLSVHGTVIKRIDPEGEEKERLAKEAEAAKKREDEAAAKEAARRSRALLATYTSEKDIEDARARALADNRKVVQQIEDRMEALRKRQAGYEKELEFYKGNNKPPAKLAEDVNNAQLELTAQQNSLEAKKKEVAGINAKYDDDKKRYTELTRRR